MTQRAEGNAVLAPFAGESVDAMGFRATMDRSERGLPRVRITRLAGDHAGEVVLQADVELTVGSHRIQQYVARFDVGGGAQELWRLPVAWHIGEQRWIHLSWAFLLPQGEDGSEEDYARHLSRWNDNCVFCHNTEPNPGRTAEGTFATEVGELGIACEACHGLGSVHAEEQRWPLRRMLGALGPEANLTVARGHGGQAGGLGMEICGRCHGNRIAFDLASVLAHGDPFVPGTPLHTVSRPIYRDSALASTEGLPFAERFWPDGTPRLSAYEYQAVKLSPCHVRGGLECADCHTMHGAEPSMQLRPGVERVCDGCHPAEGLSAGHDAPAHASVACQGCHMPQVTYGLLQGMTSHRISIPRPAAWVGRDDQPDACTQCHVDRSRTWAALGVMELGFSGDPPGVAALPEDWASRVELDLVGGDPIARALAAAALSRREAAGDPRRRGQALLGAFEDEYPAVRFMAWQGLRQLAAQMGDVEALAELDEPPPDDPLLRISLGETLRRRWGISALHQAHDRVLALELARDDRAIEIGE